MKKHRLMVLGVSLLASLGVLSSGFAGWVIAADPISKDGVGSISADWEVVTNGVESVTAGEVDTAVCFAANGTTVGNGWLQADKVSADLEASFTYTIKLYESSKMKTLSFSELKFEEVGTGDNQQTKGYAAAQAKGVVGKLPIFVSAPASDKTAGYILITAGNNTSVTLGDSGQSQSASVTLQSETSVDVTFSIHFAWGTAFEGKNPLDYYNALKNTPENIKNAQDTIAKLMDANGATFKLSFTVGVAAEA